MQVDRIKGNKMYRRSLLAGANYNPLRENQKASTGSRIERKKSEC